ncbi:MAG: hypothetical protein ACLFV7_04310 [Phycisphaerae bacterium]
MSRQKNAPSGHKRKYIGIAVLGGLVLAGIVAAVVATRTNGTGPQTTTTAPDGGSGREIWIEDLADPLVIAPGDHEAVAMHAAYLTGLTSLPAKLPDSLRGDARPRMVICSVSDGIHTARVFVGGGNGLLAAMEDAADRLKAELGGGYRPQWLRVDIVQDVWPIPEVSLVRPLKNDRSLAGLATGRNRRLMLLPIELTRERIVSDAGLLEPMKILPFLKLRPWRAKGGSFPPEAIDEPMYRFRTLALFTDGRSVKELFRGHRKRETLTPELLTERAKLAGQYLARVVDKDGRFGYHYRADKGVFSSSYNILRHAGTTYSMFELYEVTGDERLRAAAERALKYLYRHIVEAPATIQGRSFVADEGMVKLGGAGLAAVAIAKAIQTTGNREHLTVLRRLGRWMQSVQDSKTGEFHIHFQTWPAGIKINRKSIYYPGEAILGLIRLHQLDPDGGWLASAEKGARYLAESYQGKELPADHWLLYGLNDIHAASGDEVLLKHGMAIAMDAIVAKQRGDKGIPPDWAGSFYTPPRSTPTATRMEGLCAAYFLARRAGATDKTAKMLPAIRRGVNFSLQCQLMPETAMFMAQPSAALGGLRGELQGFGVRIDYVQHTMSALLQARTILGGATDSR